MFRLRRTRRGSAITETGPALFLLIICIFFPMMNVIQIGAAYAIAQLYHDYIIREVACTDPSRSQVAIDKINADFNNNALFNYIKIQPGQFNVTEGPTYLLASGAALNSVPPAGDAVRRDIEKVRLTTRVVVQPYFTIPFFPGVPGLSAPVPFVIQSNRPQEEKGLN